MTFLVFKALHLIAMVAWFAGVFYLPRLFVYHVDIKDEVSYQRFCLMERRLYWAIMWPAMLMTLFFGFAMLYMFPVYLNLGWLHAKLTLVFGLILYHLYCGHCLRAFAHKKNTRTEKFFRIINEIPTVILVATIFLAVLRPF